MIPREDYLSGKVSHHEYYIALAREKAIASTNLRLLGLYSITDLRQRYNKDNNLNNIPLHLFDRLTAAYNMYNNERMTLSDGVCIYKALLIEMIK